MASSCTCRNTQARTQRQHTQKVPTQTQKDRHTHSDTAELARRGGSRESTDPRQLAEGRIVQVHGATEAILLAKAFRDNLKAAASQRTGRERGIAMHKEKEEKTHTRWVGQWGTWSQRVGQWGAWSQRDTGWSVRGCAGACARAWFCRGSENRTREKKVDTAQGSPWPGRRKRPASGTHLGASGGTGT